MTTRYITPEDVQVRSLLSLRCKNCCLIFLYQDSDRQTEYGTRYTKNGEPYNDDRRYVVCPCGVVVNLAFGDLRR